MSKILDKEIQMKITDKLISDKLDIPYQTIQTWKKTKPKLYNHLKLGFELEATIQELKPKADKYDSIKAMM